MVESIISHSRSASRASRGLPFVFATGYGQRGVPEPYRGTPTLGKPFDADALEQAIKAVL